MRTGYVIAAVIALCAMAALALAQSQPANVPCSRSAAGTSVCPPTGTNMGQSDYQRAPHPAEAEEPAITVEPTPPPAVTEPQPVLVPAETGAGPEVDASLGERRNIAVDDRYIYVLQGDEVVKLDKNDLRVVGRTKIPQPSSP
jgi:hypothetical protein